MQHNFDFNRWIRDGIPFLPLRQQTQLLAAVDRARARAPADRHPSTQNDIDFVAAVDSAVRRWYAGGAAEPSVTVAVGTKHVAAQPRVHRAAQDAARAGARLVRVLHREAGAVGQGRDPRVCARRAPSRQSATPRAGGGALLTSRRALHPTLSVELLRLEPTRGSQSAARCRHTCIPERYRSLSTTKLIGAMQVHDSAAACRWRAASAT